MFELIFQPSCGPFVIALLVLLGIAILEGVCLLLGFGLFQFLDTLLPDYQAGPDLDISSDIEAQPALSRFLSWLRVGKVPLLMLLVIFLTCFGLIGLGIQLLFSNLFGFFLNSLLASIFVFIISLPCVRLFAGILEKIMPNDETDAVSVETLVGRVGIITIGEARQNSPAEARVRDQHGTTHYVMVEPDNSDTIIKSGSEVLLIKNNGTTFIVIPNPSQSLMD